MSSHEFTDELQRRGFLEERLVAKLREKLAEADRPLSAQAVAKMLVQSNRLSEQQAAEALSALLARGVDIDAVAVAEKRDHGAHVTLAGDITEDDSAGISVFAPFLTSDAPQVPSTSLPPASEDDELTLAPVDEDDRPADHVWSWSDEPASESEPDLRHGTPEPVEEPSERPAVVETPLVAAATPQRWAAGENAISRDSKKKKKPIRRANEWDSPLILIGGGALLLLLLCGAAVWFLLRNRSIEDRLELAKQAADAGAYGQAIEIYEGFLADYGRHPERSATRVKLATIRLRRDIESGDLARALSTAEEQLHAVEGEEKFAELANEELAALLPQLAAGLATRADAAETREESQAWIDRATAALALASNTKFIPVALGNKTQLDEVRATLARIARRDQRQIDLARSLDQMAIAVEAGDVNAAYAAHRRLIEQHPVLASDAALAAMIKKATAAEQAKIRFAADERPAETSEPATPWGASLALAHRRGAAAAAVGDSAAVCVQIEGAIYGLDSATGRLLWRRHVGSVAQQGSFAAPTAVGEDVLAIDGAGQALLRLEAATGRFAWRAAIGEEFARPLVIGNRAYLAGSSGRLYVVDLESGARIGHIEFTQPLRATPAVDRQERRLYICGEHSNVYCLSLTDMSCQSVFYLGHAKGSIQVAPAVIQDKLVLLENDGVASCRLRLMLLDEQGAIASQAAERRLTGLAASPPLLAGRRLIVVTDRGQLDVFDIGAGSSDDAVSLVASREATDDQPLVRFVAVADGHLWVGDRQLTKHAISPTGNRLPVVGTDNDYLGATFDHPLQVIGQTLVHVHRPKGRPGFVVAAMDGPEGRVLWETGLAIPLAGPPVVDASKRALTAVNANGDAFRLDAAAIRARVLDQPFAAQSAPSELPSLRASAELGGGRAAFSSAGFDRILIVDTAQGSPAGRWLALPGPLACPVTQFGDGILAPLALGQVLYLNPVDGSPMALPFQPIIEPGTKYQFTSPGVADGADRMFVVSDGRKNVYLVSLAAQPQPNLRVVTEVNLASDPIVSSLVVVRDVAIGVTKKARLVRLQLPSLDTSGDTQLGAPCVWGPYPAGERILVATADGMLTNVSTVGSTVWSVSLEHGELIGPPLVNGEEMLVAYRRGTLERRALSDGRPLASIDVAHPLTAGPVPFLGRIVLTCHDGALLIVDRP